MVQIQSPRPLIKEGVSPPLCVLLRKTKYPPQSMRFARSESDAQRFISLRDLKQRPCKRVSGGKSGSLPFQGRVREGFPLENLTYELAKESSEHLNEVKMRALRGNCQKFPSRSEILSDGRSVQIQSPRPLIKEGVSPPLCVLLCKTEYPPQSMRFARSKSDAHR